MGWTAVLLAGSRPTGDPLAEAMGAKHKALIPIAGEPMVVRPLRALLASPSITRIVVLTQEPQEIASAIPDDQRLELRVSQGTIAETIEQLLIDRSTQLPLLVTTADHALLDEAMIAEFVEAADGFDLAVAVVERAPLIARFPAARRTWIRFRGGSYSGANLFALGSRRALAAVELWRSVEQDRKKGWRMLSALGPALLLGAVLRLRTIHQSATAIGRKFRLKARVVEMTDPLAAVDVDKVEDHALVEAVIAGRA